MNSIFIFSLIIFSLGIFLLKGYKIKKNYIYCFLITFVVILFCINIEESINACKNGLILSFNSVIPTVFTFSIICNFLILYDGISIYSKLLGPIICKPLRLNPRCAFPIIASMLCGYPLGAKYSSDLYEMKLITFNEYERLLKIASNAGPIFIIGAVGTSMLKDPKYGYFLLISNFLSIFFIGLLTLPKSKPNYNFKNEKKSFKEINFGNSIDKSIKNSIKTTFTVCGYVVAFSVIISFFKNSLFIQNIFSFSENLLGFKENSLFGIFLGSIEMTNGCNIISSSSLSIHLKLGIISFLLSFSGLSIIAQVSGFSSKNNFSLKNYFISKVIQGIFSFALSFSLSKIFFISTETFGGEIKKTTSIENLILVAIIILVIPFLINKLKILFHNS